MFLFLFYIFIRDLEKIFKVKSVFQYLAALWSSHLSEGGQILSACHHTKKKKNMRHYTSPNLHHTPSHLHCGKFPVLPVMKGRSKAGTALNNRNSCDLVPPRGKDIQESLTILPSICYISHQSDLSFRVVICSSLIRPVVSIVILSGVILVSAVARSLSVTR